MKKIISIALVLVLLISVLAGCGDGAKTPGGSAPDDSAPSSAVPDSANATNTGSSSMTVPPLSVDMTSEEINNEIVAFITQDTDNPDAVLLRYTCTLDAFINNGGNEMGTREFFRSLKEQLGDKIKIELYFNAPFGSTADDFLGGLQNGTFECVGYVTGSFGEYTNAFFPADTPFLFSDLVDANEKLSGPLGDIMRDKCINDINIRVLSFSAFGMREMANSVRELKVPADCAGLKMRVQNNRVHIALMEAFGAGATPMAYSELYTALQQGVVDGQENPVINYLDLDFASVQKYMTMTNHLANIGCLCMSEEWYQAQSDEVKAAIDNSAQIYSQVGSQTSMDSIDSVVADLTDKMEIYYPTEAEKEQWLQAGMTVWPICAELCGEDYFKQCLSAMGIDWNG